MLSKISNFYKKYNFSRLIKRYEKLKPVLVCTMGRSGTWYNREFFYFYSELLNGKDKKEIIDEMVKTKKKIKYFIPINKNKFNYNSVFVQHWLCPGFTEHYHGKYRSDWDKIQFYSSHLPADFTDFMKKKNVEKLSNPLINKNAKIIYYYRNPLDQNISYFNAIKNNVNQEINYYYDSKLEKNIRFKDVHHFLRVAGIDMYIKHYLSFKLMSESYPNNVLILTYENLVRDPEANFKKIFSFLEHDYINKFEEEFKDALFLSSKESIIKLENMYGHSLSRSSKNKNQRQLSDGRIGRWKEILNDDDLEYIKMRFNKFDIKLSDFISA